MKKIVTISRTFSSGGREVGKRLADLLGYAYYDKELIGLIAEQTGFSKEFVEKYSEGQFSRAYPIHVARTFTVPYPTPSEQLQVAQASILKKIAAEQDCVIVGRRGDYILRKENPLKVFIYSSDMMQRVKRCQEKVPEDALLSGKELQKKINQIDKTRSRYYNFYTAQEWGEMHNYNLCIDTSIIDVKTAAEMIKVAVETMQIPETPTE